ncbi:SRPBCC family protein [Propionibacteriaceae bacterium Y1700]|uniref:SRPBCC family protein n=1 Tax=Microlunatus sp. Y1700 TaxID=3418487 RepID=UPI003DA724E9
MTSGLLIMEYRFCVTAQLAASLSDVFVLLSDPRRRPEWQSSLRRVIMLDPGTPRIGTRWRDVTVIGAQPELEITEWETDRRWTEVGRWHGVTVVGTLTFSPVDQCCTVNATATITAPGWRIPIGWGAALLAPRGIRHDLHRAGRLLG